MYNNILFDLDDTILDFSKAEEDAISSTLKHIFIEPKPEILKRYSQLNLQQWKLLEKEMTTRAELRINRFQNLFDELKVNYPAKDAAAFYENKLSSGHYFIEGAESVLRTLSQHKSLYLVTNGTASVQRGRLASADIIKYFKNIFISEDIGFNKPAQEFFDYCFSMMNNTDKEKTIIIGDSLSSDIQGGINAGIKTVWFNPERERNNSGITPDYEVHTLKEVIDIAVIDSRL